MSLFVAIFGMTPFGWRFAGALAGILMLPGMYLLGKQLTKKTHIAAFACLLMADKKNLGCRTGLCTVRAGLSASYSDTDSDYRQFPCALYHFCLFLHAAIYSDGFYAGKKQGQLF